MNHDYKIGDVVQLNSGSKDMTVTSISADSVTVQFIGADDRLHTGTFHHAAVKLIRAVNVVQPTPAANQSEPETSVPSIDETDSESTDDPPTDAPPNDDLPKKSSKKKKAE